MHCQYSLFKEYTLFPQFPRLKEEVTVVPKKERRDRDSRRRENRVVRRRDKPLTIQSHSIFEQGPADSVHNTGAEPLHLQ